MKTVTQKCWLTADGKKLVKDGDESAASLFAVPGQSIHESVLEGVSNAKDFVKEESAEPERKIESDPKKHGKGK